MRIKTRSFCAVVAALFLTTAITASAQEHLHHADSSAGMSVAECVDDPNIPFGYYRHKHCLLHRHGSVKEILQATGSNCCEGEEIGGECRATRIYLQGDKWYADLDGLPCEIDYETVRFDVSLPKGVWAMVCAGKAIINPATGQASFCPSQYCAASATGG